METLGEERETPEEGVALEKEMTALLMGGTALVGDLVEGVTPEGKATPVVVGGPVRVVIAVFASGRLMINAMEI